MSRGWVGIDSPAAASVSELVDETMLGDGSSPGALDPTACSIASNALLRPKRQIGLIISALHQQCNRA